MDMNTCDVNRADADALLPPRKRLLKRQISDADGAANSSSSPPVVVAASSSSAASLSSPSSPSFISIEFLSRLNFLLSSHFDECQNMSPDKIIEVSQSAADAAIRAAAIAKAAAREKSVVAARAVSAAKNALALVASCPEDISPGKDKNQRKNKLKKQVQVQLLYKKHHPVENAGDDEELARKLHRAINSSPRISRSSTDGKKNRDKKRAANGDEKNPPSDTSYDAASPELESEGSIHDPTNSSERHNGEGEASRSKEKVCGNGSPLKKRGRQKLKKLPLSICNFRDQANPKEETAPRGSPLADKNMTGPVISARLKPLFPLEPSSDKSIVAIEAASIWKCQDFKAANGVKQNKVMQS